MGIASPSHPDCVFQDYNKSFSLGQWNNLEAEHRGGWEAEEKNYKSLHILILRAHEISGDLTSNLPSLNQDKKGYLPCLRDSFPLPPYHLPDQSLNSQGLMSSDILQEPIASWDLHECPQNACSPSAKRKWVSDPLHRIKLGFWLGTSKKKKMELSFNGGLEFLEHRGATFALKYLAQRYF